MEQAVRVFVLVLIGGAVMTACAGAAVWWLEPSRRVGRLLTRALGGFTDAMVVGPALGQGAALRLDHAKLAIIRGFNDPGLVFELHELVGAELILDGEVRARAFRGESRRPLDRIDPEVSAVMLRLVFDDVRDPEFELMLWNAADAQRPGQDGQAAVADARKWFARMEAVLRG